MFFTRISEIKRKKSESYIGFDKSTSTLEERLQAHLRRLSPYPFGSVGKGLERETLLPFPRVWRFGTHSETGSKFLLLFSIKSKEECLCFAEKVPNGRISNVAQANFLVRMHPIGACAANSWRDCAHQKKGVFRLLFFISFYTHRRKTLLPFPPVFRPFPPAPNRDFHPDSGRRYPRDRSDKSS